MAGSVDPVLYVLGMVQPLKTRALSCRVLGT